MNEKLSHLNKESLLKNGQAVYSAYSLLDIATNSYYVSHSNSFWIDKKKQTFKEFIHSLILSDPNSNSSSSNNSNQKKFVKDFTMGNNLHCKLELTQDVDDSWKVQLSSEDLKKTLKGSENHKKTSDFQFSLKKIYQYTPEDFIAFTQNYPLTLHQDKEGKSSLSTTLKVNDQEMTLGGIDKIELYQIHLINLEKMLAHINSGNPNVNMLVDMTTGSGKSFTQALWFLLLYLSNIPCIFAVPRNDLLTQLQKDFKRLLPKKIVDQITIIGQGPLNNHWIITTHENILNTSWTTTRQKIKFWLCFDEEHEASAKELFKQRINELKQHFPILFLSATPSENTYKLCKTGTIISFLRKEKIESKIAQPTINYTIVAEDIVKKAIDESGDLSDKLELMLIGDEYPSSAAHAYVDRCETAISFREKDNAFYKKPEENQQNPLHVLRWNLHCPIGEKALVHANKADIFLNFYSLSKGHFSVHKGGREIRRDSVTKEIFKLNNADSRGHDTCTSIRNGLRKNTVSNYLKSISNITEEIYWNLMQQIDLGTHDAYLEYRVLHGLIETTLQYLTGYETKQLDYARFNDLPELVRKVKSCITLLNKNIGNIEAYLMRENIPSSIAKEISPLLCTIIQEIENSEVAEHIIDNWGLDAKLHQRFFGTKHQKDENKQGNIYNFAKKHRTIFLASGLDKTIHVIESNRPFLTFKLQWYNDKSTEVETNPELRELLAHKKSEDPFSTISSNISVLQPEYPQAEYTPEAVDALYEKGLVGAYVTNMRISGFNTPTTHHNAILIDTVEDEINDPQQFNQAAGRLRCLNSARPSSIFLSTNKGVTPSLPPDVLDSENFYRIFFQAKKNYHQEMVKKMGESIANAIESLVCGAVSVKSGSVVNLKELEDQCEKIIFEYFTKLYNQSAHDFAKTKKEFSLILGDTYKALYTRCANSKNVYDGKFGRLFMKAYIAIVNFIGGLWYRFKTTTFYCSFVLEDLSLKIEQKNAKNAPNAKQSLKNWIESKSTVYLSKNFESWKKEWGSHKTFSDFLKEQIFPYGKFGNNQVNVASFIEQLATELESNLPKSETPALFKQQWTEKLQKKFQEDDLARALECLDAWIRANTEINTLEEFEKWKAIDKNQEKTLNDFVKQEIFNKVDVSCHFDAEDFHSKPIVQNRNFPDNTTPNPFVNSNTLKEKLENMLEAQNPKNLDRERAYRYIVRNYDYGDLTSIIFGLKFFFKSVQDELQAHGAFIYGENKAAISNEAVHFISRYFEIPYVRKSMGAIINDLPDTHLLTLLDVLRPNEVKKVDTNSSNSEKTLCNKEMLKKLREFAQDCKQLSAEAFFKKYWVTEEPYCSGLFLQVLGEIYECVCHYHTIDKDGNSSNVSPQLNQQTQYGSKENKRAHEIWRRDPYKSEINNGDGIIPQFMQHYRNMWAASSMLDAVPVLNAVEAARSAPTSSALKNIAENFIAPIEGYFSGSFFASIPRFIKSKQNLTTEERTLFNLASKLGEKFEAGEALTKDEILSGDTKYLNAVEKLRSELKSKP
jgi:hypothetical protein